MFFATDSGDTTAVPPTMSLEAEAAEYAAAFHKAATAAAATATAIPNAEAAAVAAASATHLESQLNRYREAANVAANAAVEEANKLNRELGWRKAEKTDVETKTIG